MKNTLLLIFCLSMFRFVFAQDEKLSGLQYNPKLYYSTKQYQPLQVPNGLLIEKGIYIVPTDTLSLPFIDDFSTNKLRSYKWLENHITDTFYNVFGTCLSTRGIATQDQYFIQDSAYSYSFDTITKQLDSMVLAPVELNFFGFDPYDCFSSPPQTAVYFKPYYRPTRIDSATGRFLDSVLVNEPSPSLKHIDTLAIAPVIYFAANEPGKLWVDNYAYVNNTFPVNPPTIGVATLDGLNEFGFPYNKNQNNAYGDADYLTSKPIDLSGLDSADKVYLSFFYEAQGMGDYPDKKDSLIVEFKNQGGQWFQVWADTGYSDPTYVPNQFKQVLLGIPKAGAYPFYHNQFQFRFHNKASITGGNDHWHIDYVRFDKNRDSSDAIFDIAFIYDFPSILKNYTLLPAKQFADDSDLLDNIILPVHNLDPAAETNPPATNFSTSAIETYPNPVVLISNPVQTFNAATYSDIQVSPSAEYQVLSNNPGWPQDSLVIISTAAINPNDVLATNDTLVHLQNFGNIVAYDDGTAEQAYGLTGLGVKKFAYEFNLPQPDTLAGFQVMYGQVDANVNDLVFNFYAWDSLRMDDFTFVDTPFISVESRKPLYVDSVNGFTTYVLDTPVIISGKFYFGWAQTDNRSLQIGYDLNSTRGRQHMYIYTNGTWKPSTITPDGSPMLRLIMDGDYRGKGTPNAITGIKKPKGQLVVYPNPTTGMVYLKPDNSNPLFNISVMNTMGQVVKQESAVSQQLNISNLPNGVYLLEAMDISTGNLYRCKLIKTAF